MGIYLGALGFGYNTELLKQKNLPEPKCWADLIKPEYKGEVQVANPNSSGTAYTFLATQVQLLGEEKAFEYLKTLDGNVNQYTKSGAAPIQAAAQGETIIGIVFQHDVIATTIATGAPLEDGVPMRGHRLRDRLDEHHQGRAKSRKCQEMVRLGADAGRTRNRRCRQLLPGAVEHELKSPSAAPKISEIKLIDYDFAKYGSSAERKRLLARWDAEVGARSSTVQPITLGRRSQSPPT